MNRMGLALFVGAIFAAGATAQSQPGAQAGAQGNAQSSAEVNKQGAQAATRGSAAASGAAQAGQSSTALASGSAFNATLSAPLDSKKCKPGDPVTARSNEPAKSDGKTVFPKGTKFMGHVTQASARSKGDADSAIGVVFDKAILKNGEEVPVNVAIQALASAQSSVAGSGSDLDAAGAGNLSGGSAPRSGSTGGHGALGGVTSTAGGAAGAVTNTAVNTGSVASGALNSTANATGSVTGAARGTVGGLNTAGQLTSNSQGVFGLNGLNLSSAASNSTQGSVITSAGKNVHLDSGTRMLLVSQAQAGAVHESKQTKSEKSEPKPETNPRSEKPNQR
jgi:hypothetical protein